MIIPTITCDFYFILYMIILLKGYTIHEGIFELFTHIFIVNHLDQHLKKYRNNNRFTFECNVVITTKEF